jgi:phage shock protein A
MSLISRIKMIVRAKSHTALDAMEQPGELFTYAIEEQRELVRKINRSLVEVATSRQRLERQISTLQVRIPKLEARAKQAISIGRDDLARMVLEQKQTSLAEIAEIERTSLELEEEEQQLSTAARQLWARIDQFSTRRTLATARYDAASARVRAGEALSGISGDLADLSAAIQRAEERTERFASRAIAIETLVATGTLEIPFTRNRVEAELQAIAAGQAVDDELRRLQASIPCAITASTE